MFSGSIRAGARAEPEDGFITKRRVRAMSGRAWNEIVKKNMYWECRSADLETQSRFSSARLHGRLGNDLLSRVLRRSTIGAEGFHCRVRNGIGCWDPRKGHQAIHEVGWNSESVILVSHAANICMRGADRHG